jgi:hypothetical protein
MSPGGSSNLHDPTLHNDKKQQIQLTPRMGLSNTINKRQPKTNNQKRITQKTAKK